MILKGRTRSYEPHDPEPVLYRKPVRHPKKSKNANPARSPERIYQMILEAGEAGVTTSEIAKLVGRYDFERLLTSLEIQGYLLYQDDSRVFAYQPDPDIEAVRDSAYYGRYA